MKGFRAVGRTQKSPSAFGQVSPRFRPRRHRMTATGYRTEMRHRFAIRGQITSTVGRPATAWTQARTAGPTMP
ncbi:hypothetical protein ACTWJ9_00275 [Streptomyces sp. GDS52]|uniref:hypothetical protein n=1 Tax=Streptomyces TaxID=1883 RepID=UPI00311AE877